MKVGIIGGSGFYSLEALRDARNVTMDTEFGVPSDVIIIGTIANTEVVVLARHGRDHRFNPTEVNYRANIRAMQLLGVTHILAATACGSLKQELAPGDLCLLDSFIDRTTKRHQTFHDQSSSNDFGTVCHIPMADPFCAATGKVLAATADELGQTMHPSGTVVTIEGPRFSTRAESSMFKAWGGDLVNMTTVPEVVLAAEAGIAYASVAMVTDYDCWRKSEEAVSVDKVMAVLKSNIIKVQKLFVATIAKMEKDKEFQSITRTYQERAKASVMV